MREPVIADEKHDPQRERFYLAAELAQELAVDLGSEESALLEPADVEAFMLSVLKGTGLEDGAAPKVYFDVADEADYSGWCSGEDGSIHLHPRLLRPDSVLHELAHHVRPRDGHGPQFVAIYVAFLRLVDPSWAEAFMEMADEVGGIQLDPGWS